MAALLMPTEIETLRALVLGAEVRRVELADATWRRLIELGYVVETISITEVGAKALHTATVPPFYRALAWLIEHKEEIETNNDKKSKNSEDISE